MIKDPMITIVGKKWEQTYIVLRKKPTYFKTADYLSLIAGILKLDEYYDKYDAEADVESEEYESKETSRVEWIA